MSNSSPSLASDHQARLARALVSLEGLSIGDAFGERFFLPEPLAAEQIEQRHQPEPPWEYTDDTQMAIAIVDVLRQCGRIDQDLLAKTFAERYAEEPYRGYGATARRILQAVKLGVPWQEVAPRVFGGAGSMGNGGSMRVAPLGAYFADDLQLAAEQAGASAQVTHAHPEGRAGAVAVAIAAALAASTPELTADQLLEMTIQHVPASTTREGLVHAAALPPNTTVAQAVATLGNGSTVTAPDTVPFALWCASRRLDNYEEALWLTVSGLGDRDTTCAIVGGILALSAGLPSIPPAWRQAREPLPALYAD